MTKRTLSQKASRIINSYGKSPGERRPCYRSIRRAVRYFAAMGMTDVFRYNMLRKTCRQLNLAAPSVPCEWRRAHESSNDSSTWRKRTSKEIADDIRECIADIQRHSATAWTHTPDSAPRPEHYRREGHPTIKYSTNYADR